MNTNNTLGCKSRNRLGLRQPMPVLGVVAAATQSGRHDPQRSGQSGTNDRGHGAWVAPLQGVEWEPIRSESSFPSPVGVGSYASLWPVRLRRFWKKHSIAEEKYYKMFSRFTRFPWRSSWVLLWKGSRSIDLLVLASLGLKEAVHWQQVLGIRGPSRSITHQNSSCKPILRV